MARELPLPVRPSVNALLAQRAAPWKVRRPLASAVATAIRLHAPRTWENYLTWVLLCFTDPPREPRKREAAMDDSGKIIEETPEQTAAYERARAGAANGISAEQRELTERRAAHARQAEAQRQRWLETSGFGAVIAKAEALLEDLPRADAEHRRAQTVLPDLVTFIALAQEQPEDRVLQRFAQRADDLRQTIAAPSALFMNAEALRGLIDRVRHADLSDVNGPVKNSNVVTRWRRRFQELLSSLPGPTHAEWCKQQVAALIKEARAARAGRA